MPLMRGLGVWAELVRGDFVTCEEEEEEVGGAGGFPGSRWANPKSTSWNLRGKQCIDMGT